jgi:mannose-1-phosphate guanylyltransferase/mannose-6-phosphate isomerase
MLQETLARLEGMKDVTAPLIVCNEAHRFLVVDQMRESSVPLFSVIVEPVGRNTAPALTLASLRLVGADPGSSGDPVMLVMPADHVILDLEAFRTAVRVGASLAESGDLVTFGVDPNAPKTGYGYIRKGEIIEAMPSGPMDRDRSLPAEERGGGTAPALPVAHRVSAFVEKPDLAAAKAYVESGDYFWNSGIFMMRASVWLAELGRRRPDIARACHAAYSNGHVDGQFYRPGAAEFVACPGDSIDYAVMEKAARASHDASAEASGASLEPPGCAVVSLDAGWSDIGEWSALWEEREQDSHGNVTVGDVYAQSTENALLIAQHRLLATVGLEGVVVVETSDAVLVARKDRVQDVREIVRRLKADGRTEHESHRKVHRPWGTYEVVDTGQGFQVKRLTVNPGAALSLQVHRHRAEHWVVVRGTARVTRGDEVFYLRENESAYVPKDMTHRLENPGDGPLEIIEVQSGDYLAEDDIVRFEDNYNRHKGPQGTAEKLSQKSP